MEQGTIAAGDALHYISQVLDALQYAHHQKVIHRDIKPGNMMLTPQGVVKLMDFGIARSGSDRGLTMTGTTLGSLYYMSPEQVKGSAVDARSDLYAVGVSLYEMVTGQRPFQADSDFSILAAHLEQAPKPPIELRPDLPEGMNEIILMAMAKNPDERFQSAEAFRAALRSLHVPLAAAASAAPVMSATASTPASAAATALFGQSPPPTFQNDFPSAAADLTPSPQTQAAPSVLGMSQASRSSRGLYMTLGALVVLAVLVVAGIYVPRRSKTRAVEKTITDQTSGNSSGGSTSSSDGANNNTANSSGTDTTHATTGDTTTTSATSSSASAGETTGSPGANPDKSQAKPPIADKSVMGSAATDASGTSATEIQTSKSHNLKHPVQAGSRQRLDSSPSRTESTGQTTAVRGETKGSSQSDIADSSQLADLEHEVVQLASRAGAVNDSLEHMRQQQGAQGLGMNTDISSAQQRMAMYMAKAQTALQNQDAKGARKYLDLAEPEVQRLEKFLGR
ncbi:MAG: hypothetical protein DMG71_20065 [Acidobacteria bacterium]|nr:MAG: hypothetical protein DMG71_20065 [Acidobacteriota bacterium]